MKFRKIIAGMLACAVVGGTLPAVDTVFSDYAILASAEEEYTKGTYGVLSYINYGDYIEISGCDTSATEVEIPAEIDGVPVTSIGNMAFRYCSGLTSITIPNSVTSIGLEAFGACSSLTSITIPSSVTSIDGYAFGGTPWLESQRLMSPLVIVNNILIDALICEGSIIIPDNVTSIATYAFYSCSSLTSITIPDSVTYIGFESFAHCSELTSITIPSSVTRIEAGAFWDCSSLSSITIKNPECAIYDDAYTIETAAIYGYENSTAQTYAEKYGYNFELIEEIPSETVYGDANDNGTVEVADAVYILQGIADPSNEDYALTAQGEKNADCHNAGNGVDAEDALAIQQFKADIVTALPVNS